MLSVILNSINNIHYMTHLNLDNINSFINSIST